MIVSTALWYFIVVWLAVLMLLVLYRMLTGSIILDGLLTMDGNRFSPERLQLLSLTISGLVAFAASALSEGKIPEIPEGLLAVFAASHVLYLGGKAAGR